MYMLGFWKLVHLDEMIEELEYTDAEMDYAPLNSPPTLPPPYMVTILLQHYHHLYDVNIPHPHTTYSLMVLIQVCSCDGHTTHVVNTKGKKFSVKIKSK